MRRFFLTILLGICLMLESRYCQDQVEQTDFVKSQEFFGDIDFLTSEKSNSIFAKTNSTINHTQVSHNEEVPYNTSDPKHSTYFNWWLYMILVGGFMVILIGAFIHERCKLANQIDADELLNDYINGSTLLEHRSNTDTTNSDKNRPKSALNI